MKNWDILHFFIWSFQNLWVSYTYSMSQFGPATFEMLNCQRGLVAPTMDSSDVHRELWGALASGILSELSDISWNPNLPANKWDSVNCVSPFMGRPWVKESLVKELLTFGKDGREQHSIKILVIPCTVDSWKYKKTQYTKLHLNI